MRRLRYRILDHDALDTIIEVNYDTLDDLGLSDDALNAFPAADLIIEVTERRSSMPCFYIVVEASVTATDSDATRAFERASILRCATELDTYAVVAAVRLAPNIEHLITDNVDRYLEVNGESKALWFPIAEEDLESPDFF